MQRISTRTFFPQVHGDVAKSFLVFVTKIFRNSCRAHYSIGSKRLLHCPNLASPDGTYLSSSLLKINIRRSGASGKKNFDRSARGAPKKCSHRVENPIIFMPLFRCQLQGDAHRCNDDRLPDLLLLSSENQNAFVNVVALSPAAVAR